MGQRTKGEMWCEVCCSPTLGVKTTARARNTMMTVALPFTLGVSAIGFKNEGYACQVCGSPAIHVPGLTQRWAEHLRQQVSDPLSEHPAELAARDADREDAPRIDWLSVPESEVPPWRRADRARLASAIGNQPDLKTPQANSADVAYQLKTLTELHAAGALADDEFAAAKQRVLDC